MKQGIISEVSVCFVNTDQVERQGAKGVKHCMSLEFQVLQAPKSCKVPPKPFQVLSHH